MRRRRRGLRWRARAAALLAVLFSAAGCHVSALSAEDQLRLRTIEHYAAVLARDYPFFAGRRAAWQEQVARLRDVAVAGDSVIDFYRGFAGLLSQLEDPHVSLQLPPDRMVEVDGVAVTSLEHRRGFQLVSIGRDTHVASWPQGAAPAAPDHLSGEAARLPRLIRVEGYPVVPSLVRHLLRGRPGSIADLELRWSDGTESRHGLRRPERAADEAARGAFWSVEVRGEGEVAGVPVLAISSFAPGRIVEDGAEDGDVERAGQVLDRQIDAVLAWRALILDLRGNPGGRSELMAHTLGRFLAAEATLVSDSDVEEWLGGLVRRERFATWRVPVRERPFRGRLAILVDAQTASAAEHFTRVLQNEGRALVVGERTAGAEAMVERVSGPDGSVLTFGARRIADAGGRAVQGRGVLPDVVVARRPADFRRLGVRAAATDWNRRVLAAAARVLGEP